MVHLIEDHEPNWIEGSANEPETAAPDEKSKSQSSESVHLLSDSELAALEGRRMDIAKGVVRGYLDDRTAVSDVIGYVGVLMEDARQIVKQPGSEHYGKNADAFVIDTLASCVKNVRPFIEFSSLALKENMRPTLKDASPDDKKKIEDAMELFGDFVGKLHQTPDAQKLMWEKIGADLDKIEVDQNEEEVVDTARTKEEVPGKTLLHSSNALHAFEEGDVESFLKSMTVLYGLGEFAADEGFALDGKHVRDVDDFVVDAFRKRMDSNFTESDIDQVEHHMQNALEAGYELPDEVPDVLKSRFANARDMKRKLNDPKWMAPVEDEYLMAKIRQKGPLWSGEEMDALKDLRDDVRSYNLGMQKLDHAVGLLRKALKAPDDTPKQPKPKHVWNTGNSN